MKKFPPLLMSALLLLTAVVATTPSQAATINPQSSKYFGFNFDLSKNRKISASQITEIRSKVAGNTAFTGLFCYADYAENLSPSDVNVVEKIAEDVCALAKKVNSHVGIPEVSIYDDNDVSGKKFKVWVQFHTPRFISFRTTQAYTGKLPSTSKLLKLNQIYIMPKKVAGMAVEGGVFAGWNTEPDGLGKTYKPGQKVKVKAALNLYPYFKGNTIQLNIGSIDTAIGNRVKIYSPIPGGNSVNIETSKNVSLNVPTTGGTIRLHVPGYADGSSLSLSNGLVQTDIGWGTCPYLGYVEDKCTIISFVYAGNGSATFNHIPLP
jgi:hypothetical protein